MQEIGFSLETFFYMLHELLDVTSSILWTVYDTSKDGQISLDQDKITTQINPQIIFHM